MLNKGLGIAENLMCVLIARHFHAHHCKDAKAIRGREQWMPGATLLCAALLAVSIGGCGNKSAPAAAPLAPEASPQTQAVIPSAIDAAAPGAAQAISAEAINQAQEDADEEPQHE